MTRAIALLVHNWPLKLAAVGLATLLYGGLVVSQSTQTQRDLVIPVVTIGQPADSFLLTSIDPVTEIRYFAPPGIRLQSSDFEASVNLSGIAPGSGPQRVPVTVKSIDTRIRIVGVQPDMVTINLDVLDRRTVGVVVEHDPAPNGLEIGQQVAEPNTVEVFGPATVIGRVVAARASVIIQESGIDVDQDVELVPVDELGEAVPNVDVDPPTSHISIPVFSNRQTKTLPVNPVVSGDPAAGFEIATIKVNPSVVLVEGDADQLAELVRVDTTQIPMTGVSSDQTFSTELDLPTGVLVVGAQRVSVAVTLRPVTATRTFDTGFRLLGAGAGLSYEVNVDRILVTVGGSVAELDRLSGAALVVDLNVAGLAPGANTITGTLDLPAGVTVVSMSPSTVTVTITATTASPSPGG